MKPKVNVKKFDGGNSRFSKSKKNIEKQKGLIESYDMTEDSGINRKNELRTKRRFDRWKIKGDEVVVINSCSDNVTDKKLDEDEDSDFEDDKPVVTRKKRRHYTSFKYDDKESVKKFKRKRNKEGNVVKARKLPKVVASDAEEARRIQRKQFEDEDNIRPRAVQQVIMQSTRADLIFKVNIFVLLCNTLESVRCDSVKIVRCRPAICCWNVDKLRERERVECRTIGLGMGKLQDPFQVINEASETGNVGQEKVQVNQGDDIFSGSGESVEVVYYVLTFE
ncbi:unnamed protein product [Lactuca saligna]|uniref:Uncharacterized protein n=1 Tax=Lactuca saligna TaxID=75948 RepID=A0AA35ZTT1_LACSI|nr:unnamed protein product [Lactuca saligna]